MIKDGELIEKIKKYTGLPDNEIEKLRQDVQRGDLEIIWDVPIYSMNDTFWVGVYPRMTEEMIGYMVETIKYVFR